MSFQTEPPMPTASSFIKSAVIEEVIQNIAPTLLAHPEGMRTIYTFVFADTTKKQLCDKLKKNATLKGETIKLLLPFVEGMRTTAKYYTLLTGGEFDDFMACKKENYLHELGLADTETPMALAQFQADTLKVTKQNFEKTSNGKKLM